MNILLLGSGGREHALATKISQSNLCTNLFIAPGNAGTAQCGINLNFTVNDFEAIKNCCVEEYIDMVIVGPEEPLVNGIVDFLEFVYRTYAPRKWIPWLAAVRGTSTSKPARPTLAAVRKRNSNNSPATFWLRATRWLKSTDTPMLSEARISIRHYPNRAPSR